MTVNPCLNVQQNWLFFVVVSRKLCWFIQTFSFSELIAFYSTDYNIHHHALCFSHSYAVRLRLNMLIECNDLLTFRMLLIRNARKMKSKYTYMNHYYCMTLLSYIHTVTHIPLFEYIQVYGRSCVLQELTSNNFCWIYRCIEKELTRLTTWNFN